MLSALLNRTPRPAVDDARPLRAELAALETERAELLTVLEQQDDLEVAAAIGGSTADTAGLERCRQARERLPEVDRRLNILRRALAAFDASARDQRRRAARAEAEAAVGPLRERLAAFVSLMAGAGEVQREICSLAEGLERSMVAEQQNLDDRSAPHVPAAPLALLALARTWRDLFVGDGTNASQLARWVAEARQLGIEPAAPAKGRAR
ncbi:hypothetical protein [Luteitalea sp.]